MQNRVLDRIHSLIGCWNECLPHGGQEINPNPSPPSGLHTTPLLLKYISASRPSLFPLKYISASLSFFLSLSTYLSLFLSPYVHICLCLPCFLALSHPLPAFLHACMCAFMHVYMHVVGGAGFNSNW